MHHARQTTHQHARGKGAMETGTHHTDVVHPLQHARERRVLVLLLQVLVHGLDALRKHNAFRVNIFGWTLARVNAIEQSAREVKQWRSLDERRERDSEILLALMTSTPRD